MRVLEQPDPTAKEHYMVRVIIFVMRLYHTKSPQVPYYEKLLDKLLDRDQDSESAEVKQEKRCIIA